MCEKSGKFFFYKNNFHCCMLGQQPIGPFDQFNVLLLQFSNKLKVETVNLL